MMILLMAAKCGPDVVFFMPNRIKCILCQVCSTSAKASCQRRESIHLLASASQRGAQPRLPKPITLGKASFRPGDSLGLSKRVAPVMRMTDGVMSAATPQPNLRKQITLA
jgi:hypothetical protein